MFAFFSSRKTFLKSWIDTSSIASYLLSFRSFFLSQSRQNLDTWWIDRESFWPLDSSSTLDGSIKHHFLLLVFFFLDSFLTLYLLMLLFLDTCSTDGLTPPQFPICQELLMVFKYTSCDPQLTSVDLSHFFILFISQTSLTHSKPLPLGFSSFLQVFTCISCFET